MLQQRGAARSGHRIGCLHAPYLHVAGLAARIRRVSASIPRVRFLIVPFDDRVLFASWVGLAIIVSQPLRLLLSATEAWTRFGS